MSARAGRVLWRLAWREVLAERRRHLLIVGLLTVVVAAAVAVGVGARTAEPTDELRERADFGAADVTVVLWTDSGGVPYEELPRELQDEVDARFGGPVERPTSREVEAVLAEVVPGATVARFDEGWMRVGGGGVEVLVGDPSHPLLAGRLVGDVDTPLRSGEVLASTRLLANLGAEVGDTVALGRLGTVSIVGQVAHPIRGSSPLLVHPDTPEAATLVFREVWYLDVPEVRAGDLSVVHELERQIASAHPSDELLGPTPIDAQVSARTDGGMVHAVPRPRQYAAFGPVLALVLLVQVGFVAAATFATGTRRRVRELGMLAASAGATPRQIRGLVRRQALVLGVVGAASGAVLGLATAALGRPVIERLAGRPIDAIVVHPVDVALPVLLALVATLVAAWVPARTVAAAPLTSALAGRIPLPRVRRAVAPKAVVLAVAGAVLVVVASQLEPGAMWGTSRVYMELRRSMSPGIVAALRGVGVTLGVALLLAGGARLAAPLLQLGGRVAGSRRLPTRLAMRDSARQRTRSAAAVSATLVVLTVPVLVAAVATSEARQQDQRERSTRNDVVLVSGPSYLDRPLRPTDDMVETTRGVLPPIRTELRVRLLSTGFDEPVSLTAVHDSPDGPDGPPPPAALLSGAAVASDELLDLLGVEPTEAVVVVRPPLLGGQLGPLPSTGLLAFTEDGRTPATEAAGATLVDVVEVSLSLGWRFPDLLIPKRIVEELGVEPVTEMVVMELHAPIDPATATTAQEVARNAPVPFSVQSSPPAAPMPLLRVLLIAGGAAAMLALLIAALTAALAATESDHDLRMMRAIGADPRLRPRFRARQAAYHTLLAAVLAVPVGLLLALAVGRAVDAPSPPVVPWAALVVYITAVPLIVAVPFRLFSRTAVSLTSQRRPT